LIGTDYEPADAVTTDNPQRGITWTDIIVVAVLMLVAAILGTFQMATSSVWLDESSSVAIAGRDLADLWIHVTRVELNGGLYYLLLHAWMGVFGQSEAAIRSLSVLFTVASVPVVYATARLLFDRWVAFGATLIVVTSAFIVAYAQEARAYSMAFFLTSLATYLFVLGVRRPTWPRWLFYAVVAALENRQEGVDDAGLSSAIPAGDDGDGAGLKGK
jgi:mannosyltransferase